MASPRVGNIAFKEDFEEQENLKHYRLCNNRDSFTAVPCMGYYHVGKNIYFSTQDDIWIICNEEDKVNYNIFRCYNPWDHKCLLYINRLEKHVNNEELHVTLLEKEEGCNNNIVNNNDNINVGVAGSDVPGSDVADSNVAGSNGGDLDVYKSLDKDIELGNYENKVSSNNTESGEL